MYEFVGPKKINAIFFSVASSSSSLLMSDCRLFGEKGTATSLELPFMQSKKNRVSSTYWHHVYSLKAGLVLVILEILHLSLMMCGVQCGG